MALHDDEHVVDADAEREEGEDAVDRGEGEPQRGGQAQGDQDAHRDGEYPRHGQVSPGVVIRQNKKITFKIILWKDFHEVLKLQSLYCVLKKSL